MRIFDRAPARKTKQNHAFVSPRIIQDTCPTTINMKLAFWHNFDKILIWGE